jgi:hypothetical protein
MMRGHRSSRSRKRSGVNLKASTHRVDSAFAWTRSVVCRVFPREADKNTSIPVKASQELAESTVVVVMHGNTLRRTHFESVLKHLETEKVVLAARYTELLGESPQGPKNGTVDYEIRRRCKCTNRPAVIRMAFE